MVETKRLKSIQQYNIQIAGEAAVLKAVVQRDDLAGKLANRVFGRRDAIGILHVRHIWELMLQFQCFVVM